MASEIDALHLHIQSYSCTCGNRWTHSQPWLSTRAHGLRGGTPLPCHAKLPFLSMESDPELVHVEGCFRCVPLQLGIGWTKPWLNVKSKPVADLQSEFIA